MKHVTSGLLVFSCTPCWQGEYRFMFSGTLETVPTQSTTWFSAVAMLQATTVEVTSFNTVFVKPKQGCVDFNMLQNVYVE